MLGNDRYWRKADIRIGRLLVALMANGFDRKPHRAKARYRLIGFGRRGIGHWTNDIYDRLAPGVGGALRARVRRNEKGRPTQKLTQYLTPEAGKPRLKEMLEGVKALMRVSTDWADFQIKLEIAFPKFERTLALPFEGGLPRLPKPKD